MISEDNTFDKGFEVFLADTPESKKIHYQLRYNLYVKEAGFGFKALFSDKTESDEWDNCAVHFLVRHKASGQWVGGLRLVFENNDVFPFEQWSLSYQKIENHHPRRNTVEMSRLCIVNKSNDPSEKRFASKDLPNKASGKVRNKEQYDFTKQGKSVMWGLMRAAGVYSLQHKVDHWYFEMAPTLAGFMTKSGFPLKQMGDTINENGRRKTYHLTVENVLDHPLWQNDYKENYLLYSGLSADAFYKLMAGYWNIFQKNEQSSSKKVRELG